MSALRWRCSLAIRRSYVGFRRGYVGVTSVKYAGPTSVRSDILDEGPTKSSDIGPMSVRRSCVTWVLFQSLPSFNHLLFLCQSPTHLRFKNCE